MAVIKGKLKADEKVTGTFVSADTDENKVTVKEKDKEVIVTVNAMTAEYIEMNFSEGDEISISFDGKDYDVE